MQTNQAAAAGVIKKQEHVQCTVKYWVSRQFILQHLQAAAVDVEAQLK